MNCANPTSFLGEQGFQVVIFFLQRFWGEFLRKEMEKCDLIGGKPQKEDFVLSGNEFVFITVCGDPCGPGDYFKEVVEKRFGIPPLERYQETFEEKALFQLAIDFCRYFNNKFKEYGDSCKRQGSLNFAIDWLTDMEANPKFHSIEWKIWNDTIDFVRSPGEKHLMRYNQKLCLRKKERTLGKS